MALARALAPRPQLLLLDEPMSALDRSLREQTRAELLRVQRETGTTFVLVTHDQDEALSMATRIGLLNQGRLAQVGTPREIYERPASRYVAGFMGGANIWDGVVRAAGPDAVVEVAGLGMVRVAEASGVSGAAVHVAVRPERLVLDGEGVNRAAGVVEDVAYHGDTVQVVVRLAGGGAVTVNRPLGHGAGGVPERGQGVVVSWAPEACVLLAS